MKTKLLKLIFLILSILFFTSCGKKEKTTEIPCGTIKGKIAINEFFVKTKFKDLSGIRVEVMGTDLYDLTDAQGFFEIKNVPGGLRCVKAIDTSGNFAGYLNVNVEVGKISEVGEIPLILTGQIAGIVSDKDTKEKISGVTITAQPQTYSESSATDANIPVILTAETEKDGTYQIKGAPPGNYILTAKKQGYKTEVKEVSVSENSTTPCDFQFSKVDENSATVKGKVLSYSIDENYKGKIPVPGAYVSFCDENYENCYWAITDWKGEYIITNVKPGTYNAFASHYLFGDDEKTGIEIKEKEVKEINFELTLKVGKVYGKVTNKETNEPIPQAVISLGMSDIVYPLKAKKAQNVSPSLPEGFEIRIPLPDFFLTITDKDGNYKLVLPEGNYILVCSKYGYIPESKEVQIIPEEDTECNFALTPVSNESGIVYGIVTEKSEIDCEKIDCIKPIQEAKVSLYKPAFCGWEEDVACIMEILKKKEKPDSNIEVFPSPSYETITDKEGKYRIENVVNGEYFAVCEKEGYFPDFKKIFVNKETELNFTLSPTIFLQEKNK
jgi:hypothetical protein